MYMLGKRPEMPFPPGYYPRINPNIGAEAYMLRNYKNILTYVQHHYILREIRQDHLAAGRVRGCSSFCSVSSKHRLKTCDFVSKKPKSINFNVLNASKTLNLKLLSSQPYPTNIGKRDHHPPGWETTTKRNTQGIQC